MGIRTSVQNQISNALLKVLSSSWSRDIDDKRRQTMVFNTVRLKSNQIWIESALAYVCAQKGHRCIVMYDDGYLNHWDHVQSVSLPDDCTPSMLPDFLRQKTQVDQEQMSTVKSVFRHPNLEFVAYSTLPLQTWDYEDAEKHAKSSTIRFLTHEHFAHDEELAKVYMDLSLQNAVRSAAVGRYIVDEINPDRYVSSHGFYSTYGPAYEIVRQHCPSFMWCHQNLDDDKITILDSTVMTTALSENWNAFVSGDANIDEEWTDAFMRSRLQKRAVDHSKVISSRGAGYSALYEPKHHHEVEHLFALFPNVPWDGNIAERHIIFDSLFEWVVFTIDQFAKTPDRMLVIRCHPAENTFAPVTWLLEEQIRAHYDDELPPNVELLSASDNTDSYSIVEQADALLVYDGTLAIEGSILNKPVIAAGFGRASQDGWCYIPEDRDEYASFIDDIESIKDNFRTTKAERARKAKTYFHWYYNERSVRLGTAMRVDGEGRITPTRAWKFVKHTDPDRIVQLLSLN